MAKLYFYYSAMNAGKSTTLLQSSYNYRERNMNTLLFNAALDDRYGERKVASRIGLEAEAIPFAPETNLFDYVKRVHEQQQYLSCVFVDEAQFLTKQQVWQLTDIPDELKIPVLAYGLRCDYRGIPFEGSSYLLALADELTEIKTICHCGRKATMTLRLNEQGEVLREGEQVEIGGNDKFVSTCRIHFKAGQVARRPQDLPKQNQTKTELEHE